MRSITTCLLLSAVACGWSGCGPAKSGTKTQRGGVDLPPSPYTINRCVLDVALEPVSHRLEATATLTVGLKEPAAGKRPEKLWLSLHADLGIDSIKSLDKPVLFRRVSEAASKTDQAVTTAPAEADRPAAIYELDWSLMGNQPAVLVVRYGGRLFQDVAAGEETGEIHNLTMKAHVAPEGVFLSDSGNWYPQIPGPEDDETTEIELTQFELTVTEAPDMVLVASGEREGAVLDQPRGQRTTWRTRFPLEGMALVGGPHRIQQRQVGAVLVSVHVSEDHLPFAKGLLDAIESYLKLYEPLIGNYPYNEFTVVENFFSSGFAFPGFTLLDGRVIAMGEMGLQPGYLDHELLHNWWGNGVFVSAMDGNWCECLTSFCANYMRHVLEGREAKARATRRDTCYGLSRLTSDKDKPLGRFGRKEGPSSFIGYQKGAMVFAMLSEKVGQDVLWRALRRLYRDRLGKPTTWKHVQDAVELESDQSLEDFFQTWVRGTGLPDVVLEEAGYDKAAQRLAITVSQKGRQTFDMTLPIRVLYDRGAQYEQVSVNRASQLCVWRMMQTPRSIEIDPDFRVMRRVPLADVMPTISGIGSAKSLTIVRSEEDFEAYKPVAGELEERYEKAEDTSVRWVQAGEAKAEDFQKGHVLVLGKACLAAPAQEALKGLPLSIGEGFFAVGGKRFEAPTDEVLCCARNANDAGGVICFYIGNDQARLRKASVVTFYGGNSLVVFENGQATYRQDFEKVEQIPVNVEGG